MKTALITGDMGFVGRHMRTELEARGYNVTGVDIKRGKDQDVRQWFRFNMAAWNHRYDLVVHLAAVVGGRELIEGDPIAVAVDLAIDAEMFGWAVRTHQPRVVYYSSSAAYPISMQEDRWSGNVLAERNLNLAYISNPDLTYGWAKLTGEMLAKHAEKAGVRVHVFRPFSGYGEDQDDTYPFPALAARAIAHADPFEIWGDGTQVRDFIHIDDVVRGTLAAVDANYQGPLNLCTGRDTDFNDLARMFMAAAGYSAPILHREAKPTGVGYRVGDPTRMLEIYTPRVTLEQGIACALSAVHAKV